MMGGISFDKDKALDAIKGMDTDLQPGERLTPGRFDPDRAKAAIPDIGVDDTDVVLENALETNPTSAPLTSRQARS